MDDNELQKIAIGFLNNFIKKIENNEVEVKTIIDKNSTEKIVREGIKELLIQYK